MISCCLTGYDADPCAVYEAKVVTARKAYTCCECGDTIAPGERYERAHGLFDGAWFTEHTCAPCVAVRSDHDCGEGWCHGDLWEQIAECYGSTVAYGPDPDDDTDPMGPPPATQQRADGRYGCCVDGDCTPNTCVALPAGETCGDCHLFRGCRAGLGVRAKDTGCRWFPRRFWRGSR